MKKALPIEPGIHVIKSELMTRRVEVILAGCGGNGAQMLTGLARLDRALRAIGHPGGLMVTACDPDNVSESNIGRQLFSPADIGQNKASVLIHRLNAFYGLEWKAKPVALDPNEPGVRFDFAVTCTDTAKSRRQIGNYLTSKCQCRYWLDVGNNARTGQVILGEVMIPSTGAVKNQTATSMQAVVELEKLRLQHVLDIFPELRNPNFKEDNTPSCSLAEALEKQDLFINQAVVTFALDLLWRLFRGPIDRHGAFINLDTGHVNPLMIRAA